MSIAIIPARGGSKGVPNKNISAVGGIPLIGRSILAAKQCQSLDSIYVSTDCDDIADISAQYGAEIISRPSALASDIASSEDALYHALNEISKKTTLPKKFTFLQCTSPFTDSNDIESVIRVVKANVKSAFSAALWHGFIWTPQGCGINHDHTLKRARRQDLEPQLLETGAIYCISTSDFLKVKSRFINQTLPVIIDSPAYDIDDKKDLEICKYLAPDYDKSRNLNPVGHNSP